MNRQNKKRNTQLYIITIAIILLTPLAVANSFMTNALAQDQNLLTMKNQNNNFINPEYGILSSLNEGNWTGTVELSSIVSDIVEVVKAKANISLTEAATNVENELGQDSSVFAGSIIPKNGYLVYIIFATDPSNNIHVTLVDSGNGQVLVDKQIDLTKIDKDMMRHFNHKY